MKILIEQVRLEKGVSLKELSARTGISVRRLRNFEKEIISPRLDLMVKIAEALSISWYDLFESDYK